MRNYRLKSHNKIINNMNVNNENQDYNSLPAGGSKFSASTHANSIDLIRDVADGKLNTAKEASKLSKQSDDLAWDLSSQLRDTDKEIVDAKAELKDQLIGMTYEQARHFKGVEERISHFERESQKNSYENRIKLLEVENSLQKEIASGRYHTDKQIVASEISLSKEITQSRFATEKQLDFVSREILKSQADLKEATIQSKLEMVRGELSDLRFKSSTDAILAALRLDNGKISISNGKI